MNLDLILCPYYGNGKKDTVRLNQFLGKQPPKSQSTPRSLSKSIQFAVDKKDIIKGKHID